MARPKGQPKLGGRKVGVPNKTTTTVREAFENAFRILQEDEEANVIAWGKENKTEFYKLSSKLIPMQITGDPEAPLTIQITGMIIK